MTSSLSCDSTCRMSGEKVTWGSAIRAHMKIRRSTRSVCWSNLIANDEPVSRSLYILSGKHLKGFLLLKAKYFHFLHHVYATCDAMWISRVLETSKPCCFSFTTVFKGPYSKLNGNTELLLWTVRELQPYSLL